MKATLGSTRGIKRAGATRIAMTGVAIALSASLAIVPARAQEVSEFNSTGQLDGWTVPARMSGAVAGGALWLRLNPSDPNGKNLASTRYQILDDMETLLSHSEDIQITSRSGLKIISDKSHPMQVHMRIRNLSATTDLMIRWRGKGAAWKTMDENFQLVNLAYCAVEADRRDWQDITCRFEASSDAIDQIAILFPSQARGDIWIDSIVIEAATPKPIPQAIKIAEKSRVPVISVPGLTQTAFEDAFRVLDETMITDVPRRGFPYPFNHAGGKYEMLGWVELDTSLAAEGAKWTNQTYAENVVRGFKSLQDANGNGRIDPHGGATMRGQPGDASQIPSYLEVAYNVARRSDDRNFRALAYQSAKSYLDWWLSPVKRNKETGLISGVLEETFGGDDQGGLSKTKEFTGPQSLAPVDLNVAVAVSAKKIAGLAASLGFRDDAERYERVFHELSGAINRWLWDEEDGVYYNYDLHERRRVKRKIVTIFDPLRAGLAPAERRKRLLPIMTDPAQFNWGALPLTSLAKTNPDYREAKGTYDGFAWWGDIWTFRNMTVVKGLEESGEHKLAAELNWATIKAFHGRYSEFIAPSDRSPQGVSRYSWTAAQSIQAVVEHLFGVDYDAVTGELRITPHIPPELYGKRLSIANLSFPTGNATISLAITQSAADKAEISLAIAGNSPKGEAIIALPGNAQIHRSEIKAETNVVIG